MSYCQRCGEKNLPHVKICENCGTPLPPDERERLQPGYGYDIHGVDCRHGLKLEPMRPTEKLAFLGSRKLLYLGNLLLLLLETLLLTTDLFSTGNPLWQAFLEERAGLFGPKGVYFTCLYFIVSLVTLLLAAKPLYTRNTYDSRQLLPAMVSECLLIAILLLSDRLELHFGTFMGTALTPFGFGMILLCVAGLVAPCLLIREYRRIKRSGVYRYVAN